MESRSLYSPLLGSPNSPYPKIFSILYVLVGISILGYFLSTFVDYVLRRQADLFMRLLEDVEVEQQLIGDAMMPPTGGLDCIERISETGIAIGLLLCLFIVGTVFFARFHDPVLSVVDAIYFTVVSITTIGYGDIVPDTDAGKAFSIVFLPISTVLLARVAGDLVLKATVATERQILERTRQKLKKSWSKVDRNKDGKVGESEFLLHRIVELGKVTVEELKDMQQEFGALDKDNSAFITISEL